jgi:hypothetical protein
MGSNLFEHDAAVSAAGDLEQLLQRFPRLRTGNKWPGLRLTLDHYNSFRVILGYEPGTAEVKGVSGPRARRTFATIDLNTGAVK